MARIEQWQAWPARVLWVLTGLLAGPTVADALDGRSRAVAVTAAALCWLGWGAGLVALLVPRTTSLTAVRLLVPSGLAVVAAAAVVGSDATALDAVAAATAAVATAGALAPWVAAAFVDGSSYGPEQRLPLRTPPLLVLLGVVTWCVVLGAVATGPLLLAAQAWVLGVLATALGVVVAVAGTRSVHQLSRRFTVVVPAGMVLQDPILMPEPQLFLRPSIAGVGPARAGDETSEGAADLTGGASGLALELALKEPVDLLLRRGRGRTEPRPATLVLFTPGRPATLLEQLAARRIPTR